jgi:hypothetical protein
MSRILQHWHQILGNGFSHAGSQQWWPQSLLPVSKLPSFLMLYIGIFHTSLGVIRLFLMWSDGTCWILFLGVVCLFIAGSCHCF